MVGGKAAKNRMGACGDGGVWGVYGCRIVTKGTQELRQRYVGRGRKG